MDTGTERENGRHKTDHYKHAHMEWMGSSQDMKIMSLIAERDHALQEMNIAFAEKKAALAERDMFFLQRDSALSDRNSAILERDKALSSLHRLQQQQNQYYHPELCFNNESFNHNNTSSPKTKRSKKQQPKEPKKKQQVTIATRERQLSTRTRNQEWKEEELGLNEVNFDESTMAVPVCSCTGKYHQCYKWGEGGWQSSCCTLSVSMHPLPVMPNKRHARMSGRKMSGSVFKRLLSRLASEGFDLSVPLDLKDHWSRHGTNRYITIK